MTVQSSSTGRVSVGLLAALLAATVLHGSDGPVLVDPASLPALECRDAKGTVTVPASAIRKTSKSVSKPELVSRVDPVWPEGRHRLGVVVLESVIDSRGRVCAVRVLKAPEAQIGAAAAEALEKWRFRPALEHGRAVAVRFYFTMNLHPEH